MSAAASQDNLRDNGVTCDVTRDETYDVTRDETCDVTRDECCAGSGQQPGQASKCSDRGPAKKSILNRFVVKFRVRFS